MKKKIKDLTFEEAKVICGKTNNCNKCPLNFNKKRGCIPCYADKLLYDKFTTHYQLNKEVEIDE